MVTLLKQLVVINSATLNKAGVDAVGGVIAEVLADEGLTVGVVGQTDVGNHLVFRTAHRPALAIGCCWWAYGHRFYRRHRRPGLPRG